MKDQEVKVKFGKLRPWFCDLPVILGVCLLLFFRGIGGIVFFLGRKNSDRKPEQGLTTGRVDENCLLIATKHYFPLAIDLNLGYLVVNSPPDEKLKNRVFGGLALRYGLSQNWRLIGDIYGQSREAQGEKNVANFQIGIRFRPDLPVFSDAAIGRSLLSSGARIQGTVGMPGPRRQDFEDCFC